MTEDWKETLLFRQVHPSHWDGKNPNSVAFSPTPKDDDKLSVDDGAKVTAEKSWTFFTKNLGFQSVGTWAVSAEEIHLSTKRMQQKTTRHTASLIFLI